MLSLILLIFFGLGVSFFATQNTGTVHIVLGNYVLTGIPMYILVVGAMLLGIFASWLISLVNDLSTMFTLHGKDAALNHANKKIEELKEEKKTLEKEIVKLSNNSHLEEQEETEDSIEPSLFGRFRHNFG